MNYKTDVKKNRAVLLSPIVCCDGFDPDRKIRIQTHIHSDHMSHFERSKGTQIILTSKPTKRYLEYDYGSDIRHRSNIKDINYREVFEYKNYIIETLPSGHMLGSIQARVTYPNGYQTCYSSDFLYPPPLGVFKCDELVVDSTYGNINIKNYSQEDVLKILYEKILENNDKPIFFQGRRGIIEQMIEILCDKYKDIKKFVSYKILNSILIHKEYGYNIFDIDLIHDVESKKFMKKHNNYFAFVDTTESNIIPNDAYKILLLRNTSNDEPYINYNINWCKLSITNHSDYDSTINYIKESGCSKVITDSTRGGDANDLAYHITQELGIMAKPASRRSSKYWGN